MNRADILHQVIRLEAAAAAARFKADILRELLNRDAIAEFEEQGTAPTWRTPSATVSLPVSKTRAVVSDPDAVLRWVRTRHPSEVVEQVRPAFARALPGLLKVSGDVVIDPETGEVVPGMAVAEGGIPGSLRIVPTDEAKARIASEAADMLAAVEAALDEPSGGER